MIYTEIMDDFHKRLRTAFETSKLPVKAIAADSGVSPRTIDNWLSMTTPTTPNVVQLVRVAKILGTSAEFLVNGIEEKGFKDQKMLSLYKKYEKVIDDLEVLDPGRRRSVEEMIAAYAGSSGAALQRDSG